MNNDGFLDVHVDGSADFNGMVVFLGDGTGMYQQETLILDHGIGGFLNSTRFGDINGDGYTDICAVRFMGNNYAGFDVLYQTPPSNLPPVANAGSDQSVHVGNTVMLNGSGSSDPDGDLLTYNWSFISKPGGSSATLSDSTLVNPTFTVDKAGTYKVSLVVNDGTVDSIADTVLISTMNVKPVANAGDDQSVYVGSLVTLDGSGSSDPDEDQVTYNWTFQSKPQNSSATLNNPTSASPTFTVDKAGTYVVKLIVNDGALNSDPDTVTISNINVAPVADAGDDQAITVIGTTVQLDGTQSYDPDGDPITYQWAFTSIPDESGASLADANTATPTFTADVHGEYVVQLVVKDTSLLSAQDTVVISFTNIKPVANAGTSQSAVVGDTVTINGSGSTDGNGDNLTYQWSFSSVPDGSLAGIANPTAITTTFVPDKAGTYVVQLVVNDGIVDSDPSTVQVQVIDEQTAAIQAIQDCEQVIASLNPNVFKNANMQNTLINKLNAVIANIEAGNYEDALGQLKNDVLGKTDGCADSGSPDKNDWIKDCAAQGSVYPCIQHSIVVVEGL
ncbi:MAG: PKD domain-containing protein [Candidatus Jettenia sp.]|nr:MAG: PKD domain-containing protein [Candidatus Jettenia sp.]